MKLTAKKCETAKRDKDGAKLWDGGGLYLELHKNGSKYWRYKYRILGVEKLLALGVYPDVTLSEARERHMAARKLVDQDIDPNRQKQDIKLTAQLDAKNTFKAISLEWHNHNKDVWSENHARTVMRRMELDIFPEIGHLPIKEINAPVLLAVMRKIEARSAFEMARRSLQYCGGVFRYAIVTGKGERDISADLKGALKPFKRGHYTQATALERWL
ncbi:MAG: integrase arm-type DNA-binding domain-containing protein [Alphaproteobacteria bacterium]